MPSTQTSSQSQPAFARTIESNKVSTFAAFHWLSLAVSDFMKAPIISIIYGLIFSVVPVAIFYLVSTTENHLIILPATIAFALIGPAFATGLYDVAWELEKGHTPTMSHSLKSMFRNPVGEWGFAILLMICMVAWTRIAALLHALYPNTVNPTMEELAAFLGLGTVVGAIIAAVVFTISAFTPQIMVERRVDIMTAVASSVKAVNNNVSAMFVWALVIVSFVALGFLTSGYGFVLIMPLLSYASWHGYIAVIKTKRERNYE
ncbi:DUF2189 domain-containing protein [Thalassotalea euphylliae]|uniref:DUF2189 domain-containing protein n=1 Tax=Thalassotalea euphylliae TaxID=1655234 RepID=UPI003636304D